MGLRFILAVVALKCILDKIHNYIFSIVVVLKSEIILLYSRILRARSNKIVDNKKDDDFYVCSGHLSHPSDWILPDEQ